MIDNVYNVERFAAGTLWGYVIVNRAITHVCCVDVATRGQWIKQEVFSRADQQNKLVYLCPKSLGSFHWIREG